MTAYDVSVALKAYSVFRCESPETWLTENCPPFSTQFFRRVCKILGVVISYTTTYYLKVQW